MSVELTEEVSDVCTVLVVAGRLDTTTYGVLEARLGEILSSGRTRILVDCSRLDYVSSTGLRVFLSGLKKINAVKGRFVLCSLQDSIQEIFGISGFSGIFDIYPDRRQALAAL